jgi:hypothetical protein
MQSKTGPILIGLAYLGLVVFLVLFCADQSSSFEEYSQYWGLFGTLVGVATGAMPSFFFKTQADKAETRAEEANARASTIAGAADPAAIEQARSARPDLF